EKARRVKELAEERGIDLLRSFAYSDSINDLPLLELVGNPVAMNPDIPLVRIARRNGWQVIDLRVSRRRTLLGSAVGATAAAAAAAAGPAGVRGGPRRPRRQPRPAMESGSPSGAPAPDGDASSTGSRSPRPS